MKKEVLYGFLSSSIFFLIYLLHMPLTFVFGDAPELALASKTLGIAHAPGYPLFALLSHFFSYFIPVNDYALKGNVFSALVSSTTLFVLFLTLTKLGVKPLLSILSVIIFAFSELFFKQALITEVYSLNTLFFALFLYLVVLFEGSKDVRVIFLTAFLVGLGLGNHHTLLSAILVGGIYFFVIHRKLFFLPLCAFFLIVGTTVYLYLPIRAFTEPPLNFGNPQNLRGLYEVITRWQFGFGGNSNSPSAMLNQSIDFFFFFLRQFYPLAALFILIGLYFS